MLRYMDGFDWADSTLAAAASRYDSSRNSTGGLSLGATGSYGARTGPYVLRIFNNNPGYLTRTVSFSGTMIAGFGFKLGSQVTDSASGLCSFREGSTAHVSLGINTSRQLTVWRGNPIGGTLLATSATALSKSQWYVIEVEATVDDTTGSFRVWVDGVEDTGLAFSGDTKNGGTGVVDGFTLGGLGNSASVGSTEKYFDDLYLADTSGTGVIARLGTAMSVQTLTVNAAGDEADFTPSAGSNFQCVDDVSPDDDTTYVQSGTAGHQDLYNVTGLTGSPGSVAAVQVSVYAKKTDVGARSVKPLVKSNGTIGTGDAQSLTTSGYSGVVAVFQTDPDTAADWAVGDIASLQIGMEVA